MVVWSLKNKARYFLFKKDANTNPYCILFQDTNSNCGHYEPLLYKKIPTMNTERYNDYLSLVCKDIENNWKSITNELCMHQLDRPIPTISNCGDSIFSTIC
jgi:hypothetical protein